MAKTKELKKRYGAEEGRIVTSSLQFWEGPSRASGSSFSAHLVRSEDNRVAHTQTRLDPGPQAACTLKKLCGCGAGTATFDDALASLRLRQSADIPVPCLSSTYTQRWTRDMVVQGGFQRQMTFMGVDSAVVSGAIHPHEHHLAFVNPALQPCFESQRRVHVTTTKKTGKICGLTEPREGPHGPHATPPGGLHRHLPS